MAVAAVALAPPSSAAAAEEAETLPGVTLNAVVADLDDDGAREVVRIIEAGPNSIAVDVWRHGGDGWRRAGHTGFVSPDEVGNETLADLSLGAGALLPVRRDGRDRVLALRAQGVQGDQTGRICCLELTEVRLRDGDVALEPLVADGLDASPGQVQAVDLDGDGTDELAMMAVDIDADGSWLAARLTIAAWVNGAYTSLGEVAAATDLYTAVAGDTNGGHGEDLHLGIAQYGSLMRVTLVDGELAVEESHVDIGESGGWIAGIADGAIVISSQAGMRIVRWPADGEAYQAGRLALSPYPWVNVVGAGEDALIVHQDDSFGTGPPNATVYDLDRRRLGESSVSPETRSLWDVLNRAARTGVAANRYLYPYVGPMPDGSFGSRAAFAASGTAIVQDGDGGYETRRISELAGVSPIGVVGPDDGWLAIGEAVMSGPIASLLPGQLRAYGSGRLMIGPVERLLAPSDPGSAVSVELRGAVVEAPGDEEGRLLAGPDGFEVVVSAPPGSLVVRGGLRPDQHEVAELPVPVEIRPPRAGADENRDFDVVVTVFTPTGRSTVLELQGTFVRELPELAATAVTETFALATRVRGLASPGTVVAIDGRPIEVASGGAFDVVVDAAIWPEDRVLSARNALGNETVRRLQVVGFFDYRGLPWLPIVGLATLAAGAVAYVRIPRARPVTRQAGDGDATLEELDAE